MANYKTPGVYVEEINTLGSSVASVPTAIPGFVGYTATAQLPDGTSVTNKPVRITSLLQYKEIFGGPKNATFAVTLGGTIAATTIAISTATLPEFTLYYHIQMFYANGGGSCYVVSVGDYTATVNDDDPFVNGIAKLEQVDEVTLLVTPEATVSTLDQAERLAINTVMLSQCAKLKDRFAIIDGLRVITNTVAADAAAIRADVGIDDLKYGAIYYPSLITSITYPYDEALVSITDSVRVGNPFNAKKLSNIRNGGDSTTADKTLYNAISAELAKYIVSVYPSGAMAGVYARVDAARGVWKAPANVGLAMVAAPSVIVTDTEQADLNISANSGKSINVIRQFTGKGTVVWGARTLAGNDNEWRYVNVRRLFNYVEESIGKATEFVVFEPNTANTWQRVKGMCESFLTNLWREGALAGASTKDAFFVRIGLGTTMTADDILNGKMIIEIGLAASRPAEFIILKFSHKLQES
jgi:uncharacterized protein